NGSCIPNGADKHTQIIDSHLLGTWYLGDTRLEKGVGGNFQGYLWNSFYILSFDDQGNISGFSGCNCFRGHYTLTGNNQIKIGPLVLTKKSCSNSTDDVIYLQALQNTTRYNVSVNPTNEEYTSMMLINGEAGSSMSYVRTTEPWGTG
ncbi:MAG: META domain-containing protein, partial [Methanoregulaceae archaeon]|nr:META domain-containing protein [Methanoregulaceae archaeon]